jgi:hypothetical protein
VILTLAWKEWREHRSIWLTMVLMTGLLGFGLPRLLPPGDATGSLTTVALAVLALAAAYGMVCGAMMFAGEHEGGTLPFLDAFLGRRGRLWLGKSLVGVVLAAAEGLAVALVLFLLGQEPPAWGPAVVGLGGSSIMRWRPNAAVSPGPGLWFAVLPVVTLEAYAWGLFGSSLARRVLTGAAIAALATAPLWLVASSAPPPIFLALRLVAAAVVLAISCSAFRNQSRETTLGPPPVPEELPDPRRRFIALWEEFEREDRAAGRDGHGRHEPVVVAAPEPPVGREPATVEAPIRRRRRQTEAGSAFEVLWWLTLRQAWPLFLGLAGVGLLVGFVVPSGGQLLWPIATLLLGVACGPATFGAEQRDLSYQFLAAQRFPLGTVWRFKVLFWLAAAFLAASVMALGALVVMLAKLFLVRRAPLGPGAGLPDGIELGTLRDLLGPLLFLGVWLAYGFCTGQVVVWLCRKVILAVVLSVLIAAAALGLWMPSLLCRGMIGWPLWVPPLLMLAATRLLMRAWASGRIQERKPLAALAGFGAAALAWVALSYGFRAWELPDVGAPLDPAAFRASVPSGQANAAGQKVLEAIADVEQPRGKEDLWLVRMAEAARLPAGVIEVPRGDGQPATLSHLPACKKLTERLRSLARDKQATAQPGAAFDHLAQVLALSRGLRNKAPLASYLAGVEAEEGALEGLDRFLAAGKPDPALLRRVLDELNRHAAETPPPLDCLQTECFRAGGLLDNPTAWAFVSPGPRQPGKVTERWLVHGIAISFETPWEAERKTRLWQLVWAGLFRAVETPPWQVPLAPEDPGPATESTRHILQGWLPAAEGPGATLTAARLARLLDASWLSDERLYCPVERLRTVATRARWRVDGVRLAVALALFRVETGQPAAKLDDLVPKYLPELPVDPYSGQAFRYRVSPGEHIDGAGNVRAGQGIVWSTGPDRVDHGGRLHGGWLPDDNPEWQSRALDLVTLVPQ